MESILIVKSKGMPPEELMQAVVETGLKNTIVFPGDIEKMTPGEISKMGEELIWVILNL